jgi:prephenate dehydrogenase
MSISVLVIGAGLIGGSVVKRLLQINDNPTSCIMPNAKFKISIYDPFIDADALAYCESKGVLIYNPANFTPNAFHIAIIAVPPRVSLYKQIAAELNIFNLAKEVCELSSAKSWLLSLDGFKDVKNLIPLHPIAGKAQQGFAAANAELFIGKELIYTPLRDKDGNSADVSTLQNLPSLPLSKNSPTTYTFMAIVNQQTLSTMQADIHDIVFAICSHLPQLVSFALGGLFDKHPEFLQSLHPKLAKDFDNKQGFFRLCGSGRDLWQDIFAVNKPNIKHAAEHFAAELCKKNILNATDLCLEISKMFNQMLQYGSSIEDDEDIFEKKIYKTIAKIHGTGFKTIISLADCTLQSEDRTKNIAIAFAKELKEQIN